MKKMLFFSKLILFLSGLRSAMSLPTLGFWGMSFIGIVA